ncbi:hypothetical protein [Rhodoferax sp. PAMC 29310]|uniref:hypothetical protein n=1 Tax=Rhodoferax sp. PAMC 29310 TaxID=2822760 RepID=UPI001B340E92|nr:hypothetical protein [Rhodoferax sp. PAMC 29310]
MTGRPVTTEEFDLNRVALGRLFSDKFEEDPWIVFHGTSCENGNAIERQGLSYDRNNFTKEDLRSIVDVFNVMNWSGGDTGGFAVLASFSESDFADSESSPTFLTEISTRALLYATREFAGGEKLRSVRRALVDLSRYVTDDSIRGEHMSQMQVEFNYLRSMNSHPDQIERSRPKTVDLCWLSKRLSELQPVQKKAALALDSQQGGIVFALKLHESDLLAMTYDSAMGIKARAPISPDRIVSKVNIPTDFIYDSLRIKNDFDLFTMKARSGVVGGIRTLVQTVRNK